MLRVSILGILLVLSGCEEMAEQTDSSAPNSESPSASGDDDKDGDKSFGDDRSGGNDDYSGSTGSLPSNVGGNIGNVSSNLTIIQNNIAPPSVGTLALESSQSGAPANLQLVALDDEAQEIQERIKGTIEGTQRAISFVRNTLNAIEPQISKVQDDSGRIDIGHATIDYKFETSSKYTVRLTGGEEDADYHINVDGKNYELYRRPINPEPNRVGDNHILVTYIDENNWTVRDDNTVGDCDANRPEVITTYVERVAGVWYGKMGYGNEIDHNNCPVEQAGQHYTYYQFVGNDTNTTAAGYSDVPIEFDDFANIAQYGFTDDSEAAVNPVCISDDVDPQPQTACSSDVLDISTPNYGIENRWVLPSDMVKIWVDFPSSI